MNESRFLKFLPKIWDFIFTWFVNMRKWGKCKMTLPPPQVSIGGQTATTQSRGARTGILKL
jgi:hypothetical protein